MVAGVLPGSRLSPNGGRRHPGDYGRRKQEVIDPQPGVALERISPVLPERVDALFRMKMADRVRPPLRQELAIGLADFRPEQRVVTPALRLVDVELCRHDVV